MAVKQAATLLLDTARDRDTFMVYPKRSDYAQFARSMLDLWEHGQMKDGDFRRRLCALSICEVTL